MSSTPDPNFERCSLPKRCSCCHADLYQGFARCPRCRQVRPEFAQYLSVVSDAPTGCSFSGADTDVVLPNGDGIWAPYFFGFLDAGWLSSDLQYTEEFYRSHPDMRKRG
jgi:hypothetical protein